jgi:hypothetical protein
MGLALASSSGPALCHWQCNLKAPERHARLQRCPSFMLPFSPVTVMNVQVTSSISRFRA